MKYTFIGKPFLIVTALVGIVPLFVYLSLPLYLIGSFIMFKSDMTRQKKVIWVLMPLIIVSMAWLAIWIISV